MQMMVLKDAVSISKIYILNKMLKVETLALSFMPWRCLECKCREDCEKSCTKCWRKCNRITEEKHNWKNKCFFQKMCRIQWIIRARLITGNSNSGIWCNFLLPILLRITDAWRERIILRNRDAFRSRIDKQHIQDWRDSTRFKMAEHWCFPSRSWSSWLYPRKILVVLHSVRCNIDI